MQPLFVRLNPSQVTEQMIDLFINLATNVFQQFSKVMNGGLFILHGLIYALGDRIANHISKFIEYINCSMRMENCDQMGTRMAAGLISDLSNSVGDAMIQFLP